MSLDLVPGMGVGVRVPASSANLGPGFDTVGLALGIHDDYQVRLTATPGLQVELSGEGAGHLPRDETHLVAQGLRAGFDACGLPWVDDLAARGVGLALVCENRIPMSAGLGSSAAALVGGHALAFALARAGELTEPDLALVNSLAGVAEGHPDNSSASVYGGLTLSWMPSPATVRTARLTPHPSLEPVVLVPVGTTLSTATARAVLAPYLPLADVIRQAGRATVLAHAITSAPELLLDATEDWLHQEQRRSSYPTSMAAVDTLRGLGHAAVISGAGPCVLVLSPRPVVTDLVAEVRAWGDWRLLRPGVDASGVRAGAPGGTRTHTPEGTGT